MMQRDNRDPQMIGEAILQLVDLYKVPVCEAADHYLSDGTRRPSLAAPPGPNGAAPTPGSSQP